MMLLNSKFVNVANRANLIMGLSRNMTSLSSIFSAECSRMKICAKLHEYCINIFNNLINWKAEAYVSYI